MKSLNGYWTQRRIVGAWARRGSFGLIDQVAFSAANFLLHILLLRWFSPPEFGQFALLFAIVLVGGTLYTSVVTSPMMVFASGRFAKYRRFYLSQIIIGLHLLLVLFAAALGGLLLILPGVPTDFAVVPIGAAILYATWTGRHACYVTKSPHLALGGSILYTVIVLGGVILLHSAGVLTPPRVFGVIAAGGLFGVAFYSLKLRLQRPRLHRRWLLVIYRRHLLYGKWTLGTALVSKSTGDLLVLVLGVMHGFGAIAIYRAAETLILPIFQVNESLKNLVLPTLVENRRQASFPRQLLLLGGIATAVTVACCGALILAYPLVNEYVLNGQYPEGQLLLGILSIAAIAWAVFGPATSGFRALERPRDVFWPELRGSVAALFAGIALTAFFAAQGAAVARVLLIGLPGLLVGLSLFRMLEQRERVPSGAGLGTEEKT